MSFLALTIPFSLLLAAVLLALVLRAAWQGQYDDWEGPAFRHLYDDDQVPEKSGRRARPGAAPPVADPEDGATDLKRPSAAPVSPPAPSASRADG